MINTDSAITLFDRLQQLTGQYSRQPTYGIEELCRTLGVSRSHLFRVVKEKTGLSLTRYIRQQRMLHARFLLENNRLTHHRNCRPGGPRQPPDPEQIFYQSLWPGANRFPQKPNSSLPFRNLRPPGQTSPAHPATAGAASAHPIQPVAMATESRFATTGSGWLADDGRTMAGGARINKPKRPLPCCLFVTWARPKPAISATG